MYKTITAAGGMATGR